MHGSTAPVSSSEHGPVGQMDICQEVGAFFSGTCNNQKSQITQKHPRVLPKKKKLFSLIVVMQKINMQELQQEKAMQREQAACSGQTRTSEEEAENRQI